MDARITDPAALRLLSRTITLCAKLSDHVQLSHPPHTLTLRTLTSSHSASFQIRLHAPLFTSTPSQAPISTKLPTRALLPIFRLPQNLNSLHISHPPNPDAVTFTLSTRSHLTKTFRVPVIEGRIPVAAFDKRKCTGLLSTRASMLQELLTHLHARLDELTITPSVDALRVASYVDDEANPANVMLRTEMTVGAREFDTYNVGHADASPLTVVCKYFRAALDFCEVVEEPVKLWFQRAGRPLMLEAGGRGTGEELLFDAAFVFASRVVEGEGQGGPGGDMGGGVREHAAVSVAMTGSQIGERSLQRQALTATEVDVGETPATETFAERTPPGESRDVRQSESVDDEAGEQANEGDDNYVDFVEGTPPQ